MADDLKLGQKVPNKSERDAAGAIAARIVRGTPAFARLVQYDKGNVVFKDEEGTGADRMMSPRLREAMEKLAGSVAAEFAGVKLRVTEAWDENGEHAAGSLHYEGRAADLTTSDRDAGKLGRLGRLAVEAGFDWVFYEDASHIHVAARREESGVPMKALAGADDEGAGWVARRFELEVGALLAAMEEERSTISIVGRALTDEESVQLTRIQRALPLLEEAHEIFTGGGSAGPGGSHLHAAAPFADEEGDPDGEADACGIHAVEAAASLLAMDAEALRAKPNVVGVKADRYGGGYGDFRLRPDMAPSYQAVYDRVRALGGMVTSSGAIRYLEASVGPARSPTSLHYTGRALDLFVYTAMQGEADPYIVVRDGGTDANPRWHLYCVSTTPDTASPLYDPALVQERELAAAYWSKTGTLVTRTRRARCFSLTTILRENGWMPIAARASWRDPKVKPGDRYLSTEWFHFQNQSGLVEGKTRFGDELRKVWSAGELATSGLALNAVWRGQSFKKV